MKFRTEQDTDSHLHSELMNALHEKRLAFILDTDPEYYWIGRLSILIQRQDPTFRKTSLDQSPGE